MISYIISYDIILQYCRQWPQNLRCQTAWYEMPPPWYTISEAFHIKRFGNVDFEVIAHKIVLWYHMIYDMMYMIWCMIYMISNHVIVISEIMWYMIQHDICAIWQYFPFELARVTTSRSWDDALTCSSVAFRSLQGRGGRTRQACFRARVPSTSWVLAAKWQFPICSSKPRSDRWRVIVISMWDIVDR